MNKLHRTSYFTKLLDEHSNGKRKPHGSMELWYKGRRQTLPVFEIDLQYLVYNQYNGRIASLVKSYEKQEGVKLDNTNPEDIERIESFLWQSSKDANKTTRKDIEQKGQLKYGIVTKDGVIIDGNRRASLLNQIARENEEKPVYFLAVVLDDELDDNPAEIMHLETTYQMGEDAKVDYKPIEKYLKCEDLIKSGFTEAQIGKMMSDKESKIKEYLSILGLMKEYLEKVGYPGIYTRLDKTEGAFVDLNNYLKRYSTGKGAKWDFDDSDLNDLKLIYFDYIRAIYNKNTKSEDEDGIMGSGDSKDYRFIGNTSKKGSFFNTKEIWEAFRDEHFKSIDPIRDEFENGKYAIDKLRKESPGAKQQDEILKNRDKQWAKETGTLLRKNLASSKYSLDLKIQRDEPLDLLKRAKSTLESINTSSKGFLEDENVLNLLSDISKLTKEFQSKIKLNNSQECLPLS